MLNDITEKFPVTILMYRACTVHVLYIPGQHDSTINIQTVYTATTQTDFIRTVATKLF